MPFDIDSFSRYLCFIMPQKITLPPELDSKSFQIGVDPENFSYVIDQLHKMYEPEFMPLIVLMKESRTHTDTFFMKKVIARCVKLSENAKTFTHFLLVCALIEGIVKDHLDSAHCFFYPSLCYYCLVSTYNRCYKDFFASKEESDQTLDSFISNLKEILSVQNNLEDMRNLPVISEMNIATVLENLIPVAYGDFQLTEYEQESLEDLPALLPIVQISESESNQSVSLSESSSCNAIATGDATESESMDEDSASKQSETDSVSMDALQSESNDADCSGMTSLSSSESKSSSTVNKLPNNLDVVIKEGLPKSVSMNSDTTTSELKSSSSTDTNLSSMDEVVMRAELEHYRGRVCDFCKSRCAVLPVNYIAKTLEQKLSEGKLLN